MKKLFLSPIASFAIFFSFIIPTTAVNAAEFISIGTGGPTGVYFVVGNSVCRMVHKEAAEGRKSGRKHGVVLLHLQEVLIITSDKSKKVNYNLALLNQIGNSTL